MKDFAAIDFETANNEQTSICSIGIVIVRNGEIKERIYELVRPEPNYYNYWNTKIHGLGPCDTENEKAFPFVWKMIDPKIEGLPLVAHNKGFDENCLKAVFKAYQMDYPDYEFYCTLQAAKDYYGDTLSDHKLPTVAKKCGYDLINHHEALADAEACAWIARKIL